jgi:uncharacterized protein (TIGR03437 family)
VRLLVLVAILLSPAFGQDATQFGFEPNLGQFPPAVRFVRRASNNFFYFTRDAVVLQNRVRIQIADVDPNVIPEGDSPLPTVYNFYKGSNPSNWRTNVRLFGAVRLTNIYRGVSALFTTSALSFGPTSLGMGKIVLTIQPGADLGRFRLRVLNTGTAPFDGPGGLWFTGGRIPGVFTIGVLTTQVSGDQRVTVTSTLKVEATDTLSVQAPGLNPALPAQVEITFPDYDVNNSSLPAKAADGNRYLVSIVNSLADFGEDGTLDVPNCDGGCRDTILARTDDTGKPIWVSLVADGGSYYAFAAPAANGVAMSGTTTTADFPVTSNAPHAALRASRDVYLAYFDRDSGQLRNSTYAGFEGTAWAMEQSVDAGGDVAVGGGVAANDSSAPADSRGFLLRWRPSENRFVFSAPVDAPVISIALDKTSNLYFAASKKLAANSRLITGIVDARGRQQGSLAIVSPPAGFEDAQFSDIRLLPGAGGEFWVVYQPRRASAYYPPPLAIARISTTRGQVVFNRRIASAGALTGLAFTPSGNVKLLVESPTSTEATTADAPLVAACSGTSYFAVLSPVGQIVYATYVAPTGFDFATQNEPASPPPASVGCIASTAGRLPITSAAPGQLITFTGGGFGPSTPVYSAPDASGKYPVTLGGFRVRIAGMDAPIFAVARGLIAVQVPYEFAGQPGGGFLDIFSDEIHINPIPLPRAGHAFGLFDTGDRNNSLNLPALVALNQDGTLNSPSNPAPAGSVMSLFGTGLGPLSPALSTGGLSPIPPAGPLSQSSLAATCFGCGILYLGSAPGLSTSVVQVNIRIPPEPSMSGVRPYGIAIDVSESFRNLFVFSPTGVVFIK